MEHRKLLKAVTNFIKSKKTAGLKLCQLHEDFEEFIKEPVHRKDFELALFSLRKEAVTRLKKSCQEYHKNNPQYGYDKFTREQQNITKELWDALTDSASIKSENFINPPLFEDVGETFVDQFEQFQKETREFSVSKKMTTNYLPKLPADWGLLHWVIKEKFIKNITDKDFLRFLLSMETVWAVRNACINRLGELGDHSYKSVTKPFRQIDLKQLLKKDVEYLKSSIRTSHCLESAKIHTIADLVRKQECDVLSIKNLGRKSLIELNLKFEELGLTFGMDVDAIIDKEEIAIPEPPKTQPQKEPLKNTSFNEGYHDLLPLDWAAMDYSGRIDFAKNIQDPQFREYVIALDTRLGEYFTKLKISSKDPIKMCRVILAVPLKMYSPKSRQLAKILVDSFNKVAGASLEYVECSNSKMIEVRQVLR